MTQSPGLRTTKGEFVTDEREEPRASMVAEGNNLMPEVENRSYWVGEKVQFGQVIFKGSGVE